MRSLKDFDQTVVGATVALEMIAIPAGTSEGTSKSIGPFWMSKTEITWDLFDVFVYERDKEAMEQAEEPLIDAISRPSKPYIPPDRGYGHEGYAAISIRHKSAVAFCDWLSARTGRTYRLATETEWKYACLANERPIGLEQLGDYAWYEANSEWETHPVGRKKPNAFGLFDMLGNVAEWCSSDDDPAVGVLMGGHFDLEAEDVSHESRLHYDEMWQMTDPQVPKSPWWLSDGPFAGLRVVCVPTPTDE